MVRAFVCHEELPMKKATMALLLSALVVVTSFVLAGCDSSSKLVGRWVATDVNTTGIEYPDDIEFFSDGTTACDGYSGEYSVEGSRLKLTFDFGIVNAANTFDYKFDGSRLVLISDESNSSGSSVYYDKQ